MKKTTIALVFLAVLISMMIVSCGSAAPAEPTPDLSVGKALVESRCITCHGINNITNAKYTREVWIKTVDRMVLSGASFTDQQKADIIDYLAATYKPE
jgi:cytochrome c2